MAAIPPLKRALAIRTNKLGKEHPRTVSTRNNLEAVRKKVRAKLGGRVRKPRAPRIVRRPDTAKKICFPCYRCEDELDATTRDSGRSPQTREQDRNSRREFGVKCDITHVAHVHGDPWCGTALHFSLMEMIVRRRCFFVLYVEPGGTFFARVGTILATAVHRGGNLVKHTTNHTAPCCRHLQHFVLHRLWCRSAAERKRSICSAMSLLTRVKRRLFVTSGLLLSRVTYRVSEYRNIAIRIDDTAYQYRDFIGRYFSTYRNGNIEYRYSI
ncbi:unnamed protein product [Scytosiphon promiscuus]